MKTLILATAFAAAAAPVLAQTQLEATLGVEPGVYSVQELAAIHAKSTFEGNEGRVVFPIEVATRGISGGIGLEFAMAHAAEADDSGERARSFGLNSDPTGEIGAAFKLRVEDTISGNF
ncbi:MAG: hypothetical protein AAF667_00170 [Pseudomonadota bacterium]